MRPDTQDCTSCRSATGWRSSIPTGSVAWQGYVRLRHYPALTEAALGMWIHADQRGVERDTWAAWFLQGRHARCVPQAGA